MSISPHLLYADEEGNILDDPELLMLRDLGGQWSPPEWTELIALPPESELFMLPGRRAAGFNQRSHKIEIVSGFSVAAFVAPGYTLSAHPAYAPDADAPMLPLFAYGAVGYEHGRFFVCATRVDKDQRQQFRNIPPGRVAKAGRMLLERYPQNRLIAHIINNCVARYSCPAARNFALGRYEAPLPTSRSCNAGCIGCISFQGPDSPLRTTPQCRLSFTPAVAEIVEVMAIHQKREKKTPIYSFGQGCEGDPLINADLLAESIAAFRANKGSGTVNCNTNASRPEAVEALARAGLTSMRVSLNSARADLYAAYYRPADYDFACVRESIKIARQLGVYVSLNLLYFPGVTDTRGELEAMAHLCRSCGVSMIQMRNLNIDPQWFQKQFSNKGERALGLHVFMRKLRKMCPWLDFGYFNPYLGSTARIAAPLPC